MVDDLDWTALRALVEHGEPHCNAVRWRYRGRVHKECGRIHSPLDPCETGLHTWGGAEIDGKLIKAIGGLGLG